MKRILVTGASGFLGKAVVRKLISQGCQVVGTIYKCNIDILPEHQNLTCLSIDISKFGAFEALKGYKIDGIIHTAAYIDFNDNLEVFPKCHDINAQGTLNLLEYCRIHQIERFIYSSSVSVYDPGNHSPINEKAALNPVSFYSISKLMGEYLCRMYQTKYDIRTTILRFAGIYGIHPKNDMVLNIFLNKIFNNHPLSIEGNGEQRRDYLYVKDAANVCVKALEKDVSGVFNISSGKGTSLKQMTETLKEVFSDQEISVNYQPDGKAVPSNIFFNIFSAQTKLDYHPTDIKQALAEIKSGYANPHYS